MYKTCAADSAALQTFQDLGSRFKPFTAFHISFIFHTWWRCKYRTACRQTISTEPAWGLVQSQFPTSNQLPLFWQLKSQLSARKTGSAPTLHLNENIRDALLQPLYRDSCKKTLKLFVILPTTQKLHSQRLFSVGSLWETIFIVNLIYWLQEPFQSNALRGKRCCLVKVLTCTWHCFIFKGPWARTVEKYMFKSFMMQIRHSLLPALQMFLSFETLQTLQTYKRAFELYPVLCHCE